MEEIVGVKITYRRFCVNFDGFVGFLSPEVKLVE